MKKINELNDTELSKFWTKEIKNTVKIFNNNLDVLDEEYREWDEADVFDCICVKFDIDDDDLKMWDTFLVAYNTIYK